MSTYTKMSGRDCVREGFVLHSENKAAISQIRLNIRYFKHSRRSSEIKVSLFSRDNIFLISVHRKIFRSLRASFFERYIPM